MSDLRPPEQRLTIAFGERDRARGRFLADELIDLLERHRVARSVCLRGLLGFGPAARLRTDRLLSLSEDLPLIVSAIDRPEVIAAVLADADGDLATGITMRQPVQVGAGELPWRGHADTKLTIHFGRHEQLGGAPAHRALVALLKERGIAGATALLGVDGTRGGERRRARLLSTNAAVPMVVVAVGDSGRIARVLPELAERMPAAELTVQPVQILKRDGATLARPDSPTSDTRVWQKLTVYTSEQAMAGSAPVHRALVRSLRDRGAAGATSVRSVWGFHGEHAPHGDQLWQLRRHVPVLTTVVDTPERCREWLALAGELTRDTGLITSETVSVLQPHGPGSSVTSRRYAPGSGPSPR